MQLFKSDGTFHPVANLAPSLRLIGPYGASAGASAGAGSTTEIPAAGVSLFLDHKQRDVVHVESFANVPSGLY